MIGYSPTTICNLALDAVPARRITSLSEDSYAAELCAVQYPQAFMEMLESWSWGWARVTTQMAAVPNDRPDEWASAYALPANLALPIRVVGTISDAPRNATTLDQALQPMAYEIKGQTLYTDVAAPASLEHLDYKIAPAFSSAMFVRALALKIASRVSLPITKSESREKNLLQQAEVFEQRARAADANRQPQTYGDFIPEVIQFRMGGVPGAALGGVVPGVTIPDVVTTPVDTTTVYSYEDWTAEFLAGLSFTVPGAS